MSIANTNGTKSLGRKELVAMAVGNIIGGGVMTMTGIAIGITGRSVLFAYIISAVLVLIMSLPHFFTAATIRMNGGSIRKLLCLVVNGLPVYILLYSSAISLVRQHILFLLQTMSYPPFRKSTLG